ncbi:MAG: nuclease-related domain-containing protein [Ilumatobacteraceae bacterium]
MKRWTSYGRDRLYVTMPGGETVGWLDLKTGRSTLQRPEFRAEFASVLDEWQRSNDVTDPSQPVTRPLSLGPPNEGAVPAATPEWNDLVGRQPGELLRQQADELRRRAPVRTALARLLRVHTDERAFRVGFAGERKVARELEKLPPGWHVVHSVPFGENRNDIDHIVIGPGGVFTLNTKHHARGRIWVAGRTIMVSGRKTQYVEQAQSEAAAASRALSAACGFEVIVRPAVVVIAAQLTIKEPAEGVDVIGRRFVASWLTALPVQLAPAVVEELFEHARRSTTWSSSR